MQDKRHSFEPGDVDELLATGGGALGGLTGGPAERGAPDDAQRWLGARFGPFELVEFLDRGGMALVFRGERRSGDFEQVVAVKLLSTPGSEQMAARFARERQILAELEHPNIARVIDGGVEGGQPYIVMELVAGTDLDRYCDDRRLDLNQRIDLFVEVLNAVQFAHTRLVVHRDLKPSNILVSDSGEVKLLDFGIAKLLRDDALDLTTGAPLLTPRFASPEQVLGRSVNVASDVYQLGLLLYRLLAGTDAQPIAELSIAEIKRVVVDTDSPSPSKAVETTGEADPEESARVARARRSQPDRLRRQLQGDLDLIVGFCLAKEPSRRYGSVQQLADDLRAYREHRPISARPPSRAYRLGRFARRHRGGVAATALTLIALLISFVAVLGSWRETLAAQRLAQREARTAQAVSDFLADLLEQADPRDSGGKDPSVVELLDRGAANLEQLDDQPGVQVQLLKTMAAAYFGLGRYDAAERVARRALALLDADPESDLGARIRILNSLGSAQVGLGRPDEAMASAAAAVRLGRELGPEHAYDQASALHAMAIALFDNGLPDQAIALDNQALELLGEDPETLRPRVIVVTTMGSALRKLGDYDAALAQFERALELASTREALAFQRGFILRGMAQTQYARGQPRRARELAAEAVASDQAVYGAHSDKNFRSMIVLALYDLKLGDLAAAATHFAEVERIAAALGERHPNYAVARFYGALYQHRMGQVAPARAWIDEAIASRKAVYGDDDGAWLEYELARVGFDLTEGRFGEAGTSLSALERALPPEYGPGHRLHRDFALARARVAAGIGDHETALGLLEELSQPGEGTTRSPEHGLLLLAQGRSLRATGDRIAAARRFRDALSYQQELYGEDSPTTLEGRVRLAAALGNGETAEAQDLALSASRLGGAQAGLGDPWAAVLLAENAVTLRDLGEAARAREDCDLARRVLATRLGVELPVSEQALMGCAW